MSTDRVGEGGGRESLPDPENRRTTKGKKRRRGILSKGEEEKCGETRDTWS